MPLAYLLSFAPFCRRVHPASGLTLVRLLLCTGVLCAVGCSSAEHWTDLDSGSAQVDLVNLGTPINEAFSGIWSSEDGQRIWF
jgi:hypothetical protein